MISDPTAWEEQKTLQIYDWKDEPRRVDFYKYDGKWYCDNCAENECNACITGSHEPCECEHEGVN